MGPIGPYGTNEGDVWLSEDSDVQARLDADGEGMKLVHEIIDGVEKVYVTSDPELIARAEEGVKRRWEVPITNGRIHIDLLDYPDFWPRGTPELVNEWLRKNYDERTMPPLSVNLTKDGRYQMLGWKPDPNLMEGKGLLEMVRGYGLTDEERFYADEIWWRVEEGKLVLCPRCQIDYYVPYGTEGEWAPGTSPPALSRMDNETYICSACGQDEAMRDFAKLTPIPPDEWPMTRIPGFGLGQNVPKGGIEWPNQDQ